MGSKSDGVFGCATSLAAFLLAYLLLPTLSYAENIYPVDLIHRNGFEGAERFTADIGAESFRAPDLPVFEAGAAFTLESWVYLGGEVDQAFLMGKGIPVPGGGVTRRFSLEVFGGKFLFATESYALSAPTPVAQRVWTHVAAVVDPSSARLYVNGVLVDSKAGASPVLAAPTVRLGVGSPIGADGEGVRGYVPRVYARQLRFWSVARTQAQLQAGMSQLRPTEATGLVANWPMDEGGGTIARDISGFGRSLTKSLAIGAARTAVVEDGPHFVERYSVIPPGVMTDVTLIAPIDFDNDGDLDLFMAQRATPTYPATFIRQLAFRNVGGTFVDATNAVLGNLMLLTVKRTWVTDFNGDGRADLLLAETGTDTDPYPGAQSRLLIQTADGRLVDETATRLPLHDSYTHGLALADIDGDGDLDVYMGNYIKDMPRIYINDGAGHFSDSSGRLPDDVASINAEHPSVTFCDVNLDSHPDVILGGNYYAPNGESSNRPNVLLMNDGSGYFVHDPAFGIPPKLHGSAGVTVEIACADLDADGAPELVLGTDVNGEVPGLQLLLNDGAGHFTDGSGQLGITFSASDKWVEEISVADVNADGKPDLVLRMDTRVNNEHPFARSILLNRGGAVFADASETFIANTANGLAVADFDGDGRSDLVTAFQLHSLIKLFHNEKSPAFALFDPPSACQLAQWSGVTASGGVGSTLFVGGPGDTAPLPRYSGTCSLRANLPGNYVTDDSPTDLSTYHARFYVLAASSGGAAVLFQARNAASQAMLTVRFSGTAFELAGSNGVFVASQAVAAGRWYAIEVDWAAGAAPTLAVKGAGGAALPQVTAAAVPAGDRIDTVLLGWIGGGTGGSIVVDAYESRRDTPVGRLCRGDADGNGVRDARDLAAARSEFLQQGLAPRQPDCNEDGEVNSGDMVCLRNIQAAAKGDCVAYPNF